MFLLLLPSFIICIAGACNNKNFNAGKNPIQHVRQRKSRNHDSLSRGLTFFINFFIIDYEILFNLTDGDRKSH
ncbi:MAG TPA: hypothetical protein DD727_08100 [Clostridiales bacterium]|nr:hypothetical protein [Clostridiales bacterium]